MVDSNAEADVIALAGIVKHLPVNVLLQHSLSSVDALNYHQHLQEKMMLLPGLKTKLTKVVTDGMLD